jgi:hypothetical protein
VIESCRIVFDAFSLRRFENRNTILTKAFKRQKKIAQCWAGLALDEALGKAILNDDVDVDDASSIAIFPACRAKVRPTPAERRKLRRCQANMAKIWTTGGFETAQAFCESCGVPVPSMPVTTCLQRAKARVMDGNADELAA